MFLLHSFLPLPNPKPHPPSTSHRLQTSGLRDATRNPISSIVWEVSHLISSVIYVCRCSRHILTSQSPIRHLTHLKFHNNHRLQTSGLRNATKIHNLSSYLKGLMQGVCAATRGVRSSSGCCYLRCFPHIHPKAASVTSLPSNPLPFCLTITDSFSLYPAFTSSHLIQKSKPQSHLTLIPRKPTRTPKKAPRYQTSHLRPATNPPPRPSLPPALSLPLPIKNSTYRTYCHHPTHGS
ncbi:uncharacterized protein LY89DRAFT_428217 [Mollisia scopiformis]|uniref:Uncharacterized protein n=1 Tax=Mollisia scopiformis TaxID=149040 RepID=A0A194XLP2_MOLSC|nr:uncharacterized protein LY89DRAFT_428217 [Mollisia scopiformis]KUJ21165.1 hypothetical protein LY89DRAFT_428217 [Mollisia scopiformis]